MTLLPPRVKDLRGREFGKLSVVKYVGRPPNSRHHYWACVCQCGRRVESSGCNLVTGHVSRCRKCATAHINKCNTRHGLSKTKEHSAWRGMLGRCHNPSNKRFSYYGGRGIKVCERWRNSFEDFYSDMGPAPSKLHSIDRIDNERGYSPENCRWATKSQQARNIRQTQFLEFNGETMSLPDWADKLKIKHETLRYRINVAGWTIEKALTTPVRGSKPSRFN